MGSAIVVMLRRLLTGAAVIYLVAAAILVAATIVPAAAGWRSNLIVSGSMAPRLPAGSVLLTSSPDREPAVGAIVVVRDAAAVGSTVAHRVAGRDPEGRLVLQGDANRTRDPRPVDPAEVIGAGRLVVPLVGLPAVWAREHRWVPLGAWILVTAAALAATASRIGRGPATAPRRPSPAG